MISDKAFVSAITVTTVLSLIVGAAIQWGFGRVADTFFDQALKPPLLNANVSSTPTSGRVFAVVVPTASQELERIRIPSSAESVIQWARAQGGGAADSLTFELIVSGSADRPIVLTGMYAKEFSCDPPPRWTHLYLAGGGQLFPRPIRFDLASADKRGEPLDDEASGSWNFPLQVSTAEAERFTVGAENVGGDCLYTFVIEYLDNGQRGTHEVFDRGEPFRLISTSSVANERTWDQDEKGRYLAVSR